MNEYDKKKNVQDNGNSQHGFRSPRCFGAYKKESINFSLMLRRQLVS